MVWVAEREVLIGEPEGIALSRRPKGRLDGNIS
jgi:hypothetical protein